MNRKKIFISTIIFTFILCSISLIMNMNSANAADKKVIVYYFHGDFRCHTCTEIERLTKKAVNLGFAGKLKDSTVEIKVINFDRQENSHYMQDYKLDIKSVIISEFNGSKVVRWKNLPKIWDYYNDEKVFIKYIQDEVKGYL